MIDSVVFGDNPWLELTAAEQSELRLRLLREAFAHHLESCPAYAAFADRQGGCVERLQTATDLVRVPQFPTSVFKRMRLTSVPTEKVIASFASSGTSGTRSVIYRDAVTLHRLCGSIRPDTPVFGDLLIGADESNSMILNLGPSRKESGHVWFGYVMSLLEQLAPMRNYIVADHVLIDQAISDTRRALKEQQKVFLVGPPFLIADYCFAVLNAEQLLEGGSSLFIFTAGGWKTRDRERISRDRFDNLVSSSLLLDDRAQIRDFFNQVELNTVLVECEHRSKHVPPWVDVFVRDPVTFAPLPAGEPGVLCFSDASAHSYPCFFVGDDIGVVRSSSCACGRQGLSIQIERRLLGSGHAGCSDSLGTHVAIEEIGARMANNPGHAPDATEAPRGGV